MAIEDAVVLASLVGDGRVGEEFVSVPIPPALEEFTAARRERAEGVAKKSRQLGRLSASAPYPAQVLAAKVLDSLPGKPIVSGVQSIVEWEPPEVPEADPRPGI